ncbi:hypothetical protein SAMN05216330_11551 [Bradyrhizobium sp. Ghvi]|nr:hypothetical protein SAMN05216330_11551 [Bradyrhizobium sp. Ghvi]
MSLSRQPHEGTRRNRSRQRIVEFSAVVFTRDEQLRNADHSVFLQKAAAECRSRFLPSFQKSIRAGRSWGYATTCNALSRKAGAQAGRDVCERIVSRVSHLTTFCLGRWELGALSIFAASFGRHSKRAECRRGAITIVQLSLSKAVRPVLRRSGPSSEVTDQIGLSIAAFNGHEAAVSKSLSFEATLWR